MAERPVLGLSHFCQVPPQIAENYGKHAVALSGMLRLENTSASATVTVPLT